MEIKPQKLQKTQDNLLKQTAAQDYCKKNGIHYAIYDIEPINKEELFALWEAGTVKLLPKWSKRLCRLVKKRQ